MNQHLQRLEGLEIKIKCTALEICKFTRRQALDWDKKFTSVEDPHNGSFCALDYEFILSSNFFL